MKKWIVPLILFSGLILAVYLWNVRPSYDPSPERPSLEKPQTKKSIPMDPEKLEREIDEAVRNYQPNSVRVEDLSISIEPMLKGLPGVDKVIVKGAQEPAKRLIHICNWHFVDKEDFRVDMDHAHNRKLTDSEFDDLWREFLLEVEMVQVEQIGILRCLRRHGLKAVFSEGYSVGEDKEFNERIEAVRGLQRQWDQMQVQLAEVRGLMKGGQKAKAEELEKEILNALPGLKAPLLEIGAEGRLLLRGEIQVFPMEDAKRHQAAKLVQNGKITVDAEKIFKRREAIVKNVFAEGPLSVIVLGASHDLTPHLPMDAQYIRIHTKSYPK